jgi:hypothetical protein
MADNPIINSFICMSSKTKLPNIQTIQINQVQRQGRDKELLYKYFIVKISKAIKILWFLVHKRTIPTK